MRKVTLLVSCLLLTASYCCAAIYRVGQGTGYDFDRISIALFNAQPGDTILVADGNYSVANGETFPLRLKSGITLKADTYRTMPHILGNSTSTLLLADNIRRTPPIVDGFKISGGSGQVSANGSYGGGVMILNSKIILRNCFITSNRANYGGGVYIYHSNACLESCIIEKNAAQAIDTHYGGVGGGISIASSEMYPVNDCCVTLVNCEISSNFSESSGGALYLSCGHGQYALAVTPYLVMRNSLIKNNRSGDTAGGIYIRGYAGGCPQAYIDRCYIIQNSAVNDIGGIGFSGSSHKYSTGCCYGELVNTIIADNYAGSASGGIYIYGGLSSTTVKLKHTSIVNNQAQNSPGGFYIRRDYYGMYGGYAGAFLTNCILWGNLPDQYIAVGGSSPYDPLPDLAFVSCDVQGGGLGGTNIDADPLFYTTEPGYYWLMAGSPCIDAGVGACVYTDIDNEKRPNPNTVFQKPDIGADEWYAHAGATVTPGPSPTLTPTPTDTPTCTPTSTWTPRPGISLIEVGQDNLADYNTITKAMRFAQRGDTIVVADGTYTTATGEIFPICLKEGIRLERKDDTNTPQIVGDDINSVFVAIGQHQYKTVIEGFAVSNGGSLTDGYQDVHRSGEYGGALNAMDMNLLMTNCRFSKNNASEKGGALYCLASKVTLQNCEIEKNTSHHGGGLYGESSSLSIMNCLIMENETEEPGGGLYVTDSELFIINCKVIQNITNHYYGWGSGAFTENSHSFIINTSFSKNSGQGYGAGLAVDDGTTHVINCHFKANTTTGSGGGLYLRSQGPKVIENCLFRGNHADYEGGGIYIDTLDRNTTIQNCRIEENISEYGGGIYSESQKVLITDCLIRNNSADTGGGLGLNWGNATVVNTLIAYNRSTGVSEYSGGGGMIWAIGVSKLINCVIYGNSSIGYGGGVREGTFWSSEFEQLSLTNCILWENVPDEIGLFHDNSHDIVASFSDIQSGYPGTGNIDADPMFESPSRSDFHLTADSPCIDAGDLRFAPLEDFEGDRRPDAGSGLADIGIDEFYPGYKTPIILMAGYFDTNLKVGHISSFNMIALATNATQVEILYQGLPTGLKLDRLDTTPVAIFQRPETLPAPSFSGSVILELQAEYRWGVSALWPYFTVE